MKEKHSAVTDWRKAKLTKVDPANDHRSTRDSTKREESSREILSVAVSGIFTIVSKNSERLSARQGRRRGASQGCARDACKSTLRTDRFYASLPLVSYAANFIAQTSHDALYSRTSSWLGTLVLTAFSKLRGTSCSETRDDSRYVSVRDDWYFFFFLNFSKCVRKRTLC